MTDTDYRHVIFVVDRSGSMHGVDREASRAINAFVKDLGKSGKGRTTVTLRQFDTEHEEVYSFRNLDNIPEYTLVPRGMTALNDAIGLALVGQGHALAYMPEKNRPGTVQFVVMTDGFENSSHEYTQADIAAMIKTQRETYGWEIVYLSADPTAQQQAQDYGIPLASSAIFDTENVDVATASTSGLLNANYVTGQSVRYSSQTRGKMSDRTHLFQPDDEDE